jgi:hypothetical protein
MATLIFAGTLVALSAVLLLWHAYERGQAELHALSNTELEYQRLRFRRRSLASSLVGLSGILIAVTEWIVEPLFLICFWVSILALLGWIVAIATADWTATRRYYATMRAEQMAEHAALRAEIERYKRERNKK